MPLTVTALENRAELRDRADSNQRGLALVRYFLVDGTRDTAEALTATGVPRVGDAYGGFAPGALCQTLSAEVFSALAVKVTASYADPERAVFDQNPPPVGPDSNFTEIETGVTSNPVEFGWDALLGPPDTGTVPTIGPLEGVSRQLGTLTARVTVYVDVADVQDCLTLALSLAGVGALNDDTLTFPPLKGTTIEWVLAAGQVMLLGVAGPKKFTSGESDVWYELVYTLELRPDFTVQILNKDAEGAPISSSLAHVQPWEDFTGLWP